MTSSNFSASEFRKHPAAQRFFYFCFQDDLLPGRSLSSEAGDYSIQIEPAGSLEVSGVAITATDVSDPITGEVAEAGKTLVGFFTGGINGEDYTITATAKDDGSPTKETLPMVRKMLVRVLPSDA